MLAVGQVVVNGLKWATGVNDAHEELAATRQDLGNMSERDNGPADGGHNDPAQQSGPMIAAEANEQASATLRASAQAIASNV